MALDRPVHGIEEGSENPKKAIFGEFTFRNCLKSREGSVWSVLFAEIRRQEKPHCPTCRLAEVPVPRLFGISKQFLSARL
jgi:hypothetical protein